MANTMSIVSPSIQWSNYTDIKIKIKARKYGGPNATQGKISVSQSETELLTVSPSSTSLSDYGPTGIEPVDGTITISCPGASQSKGCGVSEIIITGTETSGGGGGGDTPSLADSDFALENDPIALNFDLYNNSTAQTINYTTSSTGAVTIAKSDYATFDIDQDNKTITVTPTAKTSEKTITVNQAADATYNAGSATFTLTITDSTPKAGAWEWVNLADLTGDDVFVIVGNNGNTYALSNNNGTNSAPSAVAVTIDGDEITSDVDNNIKWTISGNADDGYTFYPYGDTDNWLYCTNTNNGVRVGTNDGKTFTLNSGYLYHNGTSRYMGVYNSSDWRCYTSINANIKDQSFAIYKYVNNAAVKNPVISVEESFIGSTTATITCATEGAAIKYSYDGENWNDYTEALTITETTTIYAKAVKNTDESAVVSKTTTRVLPTPTVTISGDLTVDLAGETDVNAGTLTATVTYNDAAVDGATVTWNSSDPAIAAINENTGVVTLKKRGTVTFTATYAGNSDYAEATDTKQITVIDSKAPGSEGKPYTVAQAIDAIDNGGTVENVYVSGIVSTVATKVNSSGQMSYYISDDGTKTSELQAYNGKGLNNTPFSAITDVELYDRVTIVGSLTKYGDIYEFSANNYLVTQTHRSVNTITVEGGTSKNIDLGNSETSITLSATAANGATVTYVVDTENSTLNADDYTFSEGMLTVTNPNSTGGDVVIIASAEGDIAYYDGTETITVTVIPATKADAEFEIDTDSDSTPYGTPYELVYVVTEGYDGTITYTSSNDAIADVAIGAETITFTPKAVGTAVFTISVPETDLYNAAPDATFTLTVTALEGSTEAYVATTTVFNETFAGCEGTGGNDDQWSGSIASGTLVADKTGWSFTNGSGALECAKFGTSKNKGSATTPALGESGTLSLSFRAAAWNGGSEGTTLNLSVSEGTISKSSVTLTKGAFSTFTATITGATAATTITFEAQNAGNNRFFLDDVVVTKGGDPLTAKLNGDGYATYCSQYPLDFSDYKTAGYTAWKITGVSGTTITFEKITGSIKGGQGVLLKGEAGETISLTSVGSEYLLEDNMLVGSTAPTYITATSGDYTNFGLKGNAFIKANDGVLPANKAYLPILTDNIPSEARLSFVFNDDETTTGIADVRSKMSDGSYYDLQGRKVNGKLPKGLYIVNGKKMVVK